MFWFDAIGKTPLLSLPCENARLLIKWEGRNPTGSVKDRAAAAMLQDAAQQGLLSPGDTVIEATSGNIGIALAALSAAKGYRCVIVMPENMTRERIRLMEAYGAQVLLTPAKKGMAGAVETAKQLAYYTPNSFYVNQFSNPVNPLAHYRTTGPELWQQTQGQIDCFIAGAGTGGTVSGIGRYLKQRSAEIRIVAVTPEKGEAIAGIGPGFTPPVLDLNVVDSWFPVAAAQAVEAAQTLAKTTGILAGPSSGAALFAAKALAAHPENHGKTVVALLPDSGERYLSVRI